jgi:hypothetical protein
MVSKKAAALMATAALAVPAVAQATHETGKLGAPGQVCKPLHKAQKAQLAAFRAQDPAPDKQAVRAFRREQRAAYKGCIQAAAKARSQDKSQDENENKTQGKGHSKQHS